MAYLYVKEISQMSITTEAELTGMQKVSEAVASALREMREYARPGMTTKQLDDYGAAILADFGAKSAPLLTYGFPGCTCISVNNEFCHGIPSGKRILQEGDLINIDVSAELEGFWSDNGASFVLGNDINNHQKDSYADRFLETAQEDRAERCDQNKRDDDSVV